MTSSRLPGKVLMPLAGQPALRRLVERAGRSRYLDDVVVATTVNSTDDPIARLCAEMNCTCFRGSEADVLSRVLQAAEAHHGDIIVEITGDCPLIDPRHIDRTIELFYSGDYDYASNVLRRSLPNGFDVQVFPARVLREVDSLTQDPIDRVHVSCYIYNHPERYRLAWWAAEGDMLWPELGMTLDERADHVLLNRVFEELLAVREDFSAEDVVSLLRDRPDLVAINAKVRRKTLEEG